MPVYAERFDFTLSESIKCFGFKVDEEEERLVSNHSKDWAIYISADSIAREEETVIDEPVSDKNTEDREIESMLRLGKEQRNLRELKAKPIVPIQELKCVVYFQFRIDRLIPDNCREPNIYIGLTRATFRLD